MPDITFTLTTGQATRVSNALGKVLRLVDENGDSRPATMQEAKEFVVNTLRGVVLQQERFSAEASITDTPFDPT